MAESSDQPYLYPTLRGLIIILQALLLLVMPALILEAVKRSRPLRAVGATLLCYAVGILWGNLGPAPPSQETATSVAQVVVPLAIPLLLFSTAFLSWIRLARKTVISFGLMIIAMLAASTVGALLFAHRVEDGWQVAGMLAGVYIGGTANLNAIGLALGVRPETFILVNAADVVVSSLYLLFLLSIAQRTLRLFLPAFEPSADTAVIAQTAAAEQAPRTWDWRHVGQIAIGLALSLLVVGLSAGISLAATGDLSDALVILSITTLAIGASFVERIRRLQSTYVTGQYLMLVFCVTMGAMADFRELATSPMLVLYVGTVMLLAVLLHFLMAFLLRIDADTVIITSTAGVFSPPFIGPVAGALKNREIVVSGLTTGVVGYAVGNYLGLAIAYLLKP